MNKCNVINPSTKQSCGGKIVSQQILTKHQQNKEKNPSHLCNNPSCARYEICNCGKRFGKHFDTTEEKQTARRKFNTTKRK